MKTSEQIDKLAEALAKAQGLIENPEKNKTVKVPGKYSFDYADLPACYDVSKKILAENGLSHPSTIEYRDGTPFLVMRLMHISGQWIESEWMIMGNTEKTIAGSITYGKRYLFCALTGMAADDDIDDPGENSPKQVEPKKVIPPQTQKAEDPGTIKLGEDYIDRLRMQAGKSQWTGKDLNGYLRSIHRQRAEEMTIQEWEQFMRYMEENPKNTPQQQRGGVAS